MGLKHKSTTDDTLGKDHKKGEAIIRIQHAEHARLGTISYEVRRLWQLHYVIARSGYVELCRHHERVLQLPVQSSNARMIVAKDRPDLALMVYVAGTQMVINTVLTMQHFCHEIEIVLGTRLERTGTGDRIKEAFELAGLTASWTDHGYSSFREILERRDAVEHPKRENVFNSDPRNWDLVPLGWFLTERAPKAFELWRDWFAHAIEEWHQHPANGSRTMTFTVERAKRSTRQAKKPPGAKL